MQKSIMIFIFHILLLFQLSSAKQKIACETDLDVLANIVYFPETMNDFIADVSKLDTSNRDKFPDPSTFEVTQARVQVCKGKGRYMLQGTGLPLASIVTVWQEYKDRSHTIFQNNYVDHAIPAAPTNGGFHNGRGGEQFQKHTIDIIDKIDGSFYWVVDLDYNPFDKYAAPLSNRLSDVRQNKFCDLDDPDLDADFKMKACQRQYGDSKYYSPITREFLREFDPNTGQPVIDPNTGYAKLIRAPTSINWLTVVVHLDGLTHGAVPGIQFDKDCVPDETLENCGDFYPLFWLHFE